MGADQLQWSPKVSLKLASIGNGPGKAPPRVSISGAAKHVDMIDNTKGEMRKVRLFKDHNMCHDLDIKFKNPLAPHAWSDVEHEIDQDKED